MVSVNGLLCMKYIQYINIYIYISIKFGPIHVTVTRVDRQGGPSNMEIVIKQIAYDGKKYTFSRKPIENLFE